jgi:hypothetical protein
MKLHRALAVVAAMSMIAGPVFAEGAVPPLGADQLRSQVKPADVDLFFNYMRDAVKAAMEGKEPPPPPPQLSKRARELSDTFRQQGAATMDQMLQQFQEELKKSLQEKSKPSAPDDKSAPQAGWRT